MKTNKNCLCSNKQNSKELLKNNLEKLTDIEVNEIEKENDFIFDLSNTPSLKNNNDLNKIEEQIKNKINSKDKRIIFVCKKGEKSLEYAKYFRNLGFNVFSLKNGLSNFCIK
ncbi:MAG: rhodanese-like domain-containing protein [bacterium]